MASSKNQNELAKQLKALHQPGNPVVFTNIWDAATAAAVVAHPATKAVATASYAIAASSGLSDNDMDFETNLARIKLIAPVVAKAGLPLTVDMQDGYDDVAATIRQIIAVGAVGCNVEDVDNRAGKLRSVEDAVQRIKIAREATQAAGVLDFCINARVDVLGLDPNSTIEDAIARGKAYLAAGATTVFWGGGGGRGISKAEVEALAKGLGGMVNVIQALRPGFLTTKEIAATGVARISIGPGLFVKAMAGFQSGLEDMLKG